MQFKISAAAVLAFVASTIAQTAGFDSVFAPGSWETISAGKTFTVQWQVPPAYKGKSVSISLIGGATQGTQVPLQDIVSGISNDAGHYDWSVPADLGQANVYGLIIMLTDDPSVFQYSNPFKINGPAKVSNTVQPVSKTTTANNYAVTSASSVHGYGVQTISLSSQAAAYTTVDVIDATVTVPCNNTNTPPTYTAPPPPPKVTGPAISNPYNNATWTTAIVPPVNTQGSSGNAPATTPAAPIQTPTEYPVTGAGARIGAGSVAVLGGLLVAALAL